MRYKREFSDFDNGEAFEALLNIAQKYGFKDDSWHNDAMPRMALDRGDGFFVMIWVDWKDPDYSDFPEGRKDGTMQVFCIYEWSSYDEKHWNDYSTDNIIDIILKIPDYVKGEIHA